MFDDFIVYDTKILGDSIILSNPFSFKKLLLLIILNRL